VSSIEVPLVNSRSTLISCTTHPHDLAAASKLEIVCTTYIIDDEKEDESRMILSDR
jgi:hypothetical protein